MKRLSWMVWSIILILVLGFGLYAGFKIEKAIADMEIMDLQAQLETARASLADAVEERDFWRWTLKGLAEGGQLEGVDLKGRPSTGD
jgi:hypothetical protein